MEGLVALPWFRDMLRRDPKTAEAYNCKKCKASTTQLIRIHRGCGYEPRRLEPDRLTVWQPTGSNGRVGYSGDKLTTCPGYTCNLNEVVETAVAHVHWNKGNGQMLRLTENGENAIVIYDASAAQLHSWLITPSKDGGGGA